MESIEQHSKLEAKECERCSSHSGQWEIHPVPIQPSSDAFASHTTFKDGDNAFGSHTAFKDGDPNALQNASLGERMHLRPSRREEQVVHLAENTYRFNLGSAQYLRIRAIGVLFLCGLLVCACIAVAVGISLWKSYPHDFTPYLKWQDALLSLSWFIAFIALEGGILTGRFLHALHAGYTRGMVTIVENSQTGCGSTITVRDLSAENLKNVFWIMNSEFWCFVAVLVGLLPVMLIGWTLHLSSMILVMLTTGIAIVLSLAGLVVSLVATSFIIIGCFGIVSFCRKLGSSHTYQMEMHPVPIQHQMMGENAFGSCTTSKDEETNAFRKHFEHATIRVDNLTLAITYPAAVESVVDLNLLAPDDLQQLLALLRKRWMDAEQAGSSSLIDYSHTPPLLK